MKYTKGSGEADVFVDGVKAQHVLEANDETGEVLLAQTDYRTGELIKNPDSPHGYETILVKGKVEIQKKESTSTGPNPWDYPYSCCGCDGYEWDPSRGTYNPCFEHEMGVLGTEDGKVAMKIITKPEKYKTREYCYMGKPYFIVQYGVDIVGKFVNVQSALWLFGIDRTPMPIDNFHHLAISGNNPTHITQRPIGSHEESTGYKVWYKETVDEKPPTTTKVSTEIDREIVALYAFGDSNPKAFVKGRRGIANVKVYSNPHQEFHLKDMPFIQRKEEE